MISIKLLYNFIEITYWHKCSHKNKLRFIRTPLFYNTSATHEQHECDTIATRVKSFDDTNDTSENVFSPFSLNCAANEKLQGKEQFRYIYYLLKMTCSHAKMHLKNASQKLNFVMAKVISTGHTLDSSCKYPCMFRHSYT